MSKVEEIKTAAAGLAPDEQAKLFRWWVESDALKADLASGLDQLDNGRYETYEDSNVMQFSEDVGRPRGDHLTHRA